jgi:nucleoside-diphosphate-sugar epimerase
LCPVMKVLLTGAFGNVGTSTLDELIRKNYEITLFEVQTPRNMRISRKYSEKCRIVWGDIRKYDDVLSAVDGQDAVIHTAAIIPPLADQKPELAYAVNVGGTGNIIRAMESQEHHPKLIYTSSVSVYGDRVDDPFIKVGDTPRPNDDDGYAKQKLMCEELIRGSGLEWVIFRLSYIVSPDKLEMDPLMFHMPLNTGLEPCHTLDVGTALANAVGTDEVYGNTYHIAGGPKSRITYRDYLENMIGLFGLGKKLLPESAFRKSGFHCGYMDTESSERLLDYQHHTLGDYFNEVGKKMASTRFFAKVGGELSRAIARGILLKRSGSYQANS